MPASALNETQLQRLLEVGRSLVAQLDLEAVLEQVLAAARELTGAGDAQLGEVDEGALGGRYLAVAVPTRGEAYGALYVTDKGGGDFTRTDEEMLIVLADWAAVAIENARLYAGAEQRRAELERAVEGLQATAELNSELSGVTDLDRVLRVVVKWGRALVEAQSFAVLLRREDQLVVAEVSGDLDEKVKGRGLALTPGSTLPDSYLQQMGRLVTETDSIVESALQIPHSEMLITPLVFRGEPQGLLVALDAASARPSFGADDSLLMESFTVTAATAIAAAQNVERKMVRLSIESSEQERRRWAMELHDETLQELGALKVMQESALQRGEEELTKQLVERSIRQLERTIMSLEGLITELRPAALDDLGVRPALDNLIRRIAEGNEIRVDSQIDLAYDAGREPTRLAADVEATLYRLVQEALNNIVKHARADEVTVTIAESPDAVRVRVQDNGSGFDPSADSGRFGLMGMRERVELVGGELEVRSRPGEGTRVSAKLPVARADGANGASA